MNNTKQERVLEIFFRCLRGENVSVQKLADEYGVSTKSITRSISDLKTFLAEHRDLVGNTELQYSYQDKCYHLYMDEFLTNKEFPAESGTGVRCDRRRCPGGPGRHEVRQHRGLPVLFYLDPECHAGHG